MMGNIGGVPRCPMRSAAPPGVRPRPDLPRPGQHRAGQIAHKAGLRVAEKCLLTHLHRHRLPDAAQEAGSMIKDTARAVAHVRRRSTSRRSSTPASASLPGRFDLRTATGRQRRFQGGARRPGGSRHPHRPAAEMPNLKHDTSSDLVSLEVRGPAIHQNVTAAGPPGKGLVIVQASANGNREKHP